MRVLHYSGLPRMLFLNGQAKPGLEVLLKEAMVIPMLKISEGATASPQLEGLPHR